jgi:hypothetical protein
MGTVTAENLERTERGEVHTGFWWENLGEGGHLEDPGVDGRIIINGSLRCGMWGHGLDQSSSG